MLVLDYCVWEKNYHLYNPWEETMGPVEQIPVSGKPDYIPVRSAIQQVIDQEPATIAATTLVVTQVGILDHHQHPCH